MNLGFILILTPVAVTLILCIQWLIKDYLNIPQ